MPRPVRLLLAILAGISLVAVLFWVPDRGSDFVSFYRSAQAWRSGASPYRPSDLPNLNPPIFLPLFAVFTAWPFPIAFLVWSALMLGCIVLSLPYIARASRIPPLDVTVVVLASTGIVLSLGLGQVTGLLLLLLTGAWAAERMEHPYLAAMLLGLLATAKPFYGLFGLLCLLRGWRTTAVFVSVILCCTLIGLAIVGLTGFRAWLAVLETISWRGHIFNASVWGIGDRLFTLAPVRATTWTPLWVSPTLGSIVGLSLVALIGTCTWLAVWRGDTDVRYAVLGLAAILLSPLGWLHYVPVCAGPLLTVLARRPARVMWLFGSLAMLPAWLVVNRAYGTLGTLLVGQWAFVMVMGLWGQVIRAPSSVGEGARGTRCS